jgi:hypothetical protein
VAMLVIEDAVEFGEVAGGDRVFNHEVALEVKLVLFLGVHGMGAMLCNISRQSIR